MSLCIDRRPPRHVDVRIRALALGCPPKYVDELSRLVLEWFDAASDATDAGYSTVNFGDLAGLVERIGRWKRSQE